MHEFMLIRRKYTNYFRQISVSLWRHLPLFVLTLQKRNRLKNKIMSTTWSINAELLRQLSYIADDEDCMKKALRYIEKLVRQKQGATHVAEDAEEHHSPTKAELIADLNEVCEQIKLARAGKLKGRPLEDVLNEL